MLAKLSKKEVILFAAVLFCCVAAILFTVRIQRTVDPGVTPNEGAVLTADGELRILENGNVAKPDVYSFLIGYRFSGKENGEVKVYSSGLRQALQPYFSQTKIIKGESTIEEYTPDVYLTVSDRLQTYCSDLIKKYGYYGENTCILIVKNDDSSILAMAESKRGAPDFDANLYSAPPEDRNYREEISGVVSSGFWTNEALRRTNTGSCMKAITAYPIIQNGLDKEVFVDEGILTLNDGNTVKNYDGMACGECDLQKGLIESSNTYFAHMYTSHFELPADLKNLADELGFNKSITADFGPIETSELLIMNNGYDEFETALCAYGQGKIQVTPMFMASLFRAIVCDGKVVVPHIVEKVAFQDGTKVKIEKNGVKIGEFDNDSDRKKLRHYLEGVAEAYDNSSFDVYFPEDSIAKTGSAEADNAETVYWLVSANKNYTIVVRTDGSETSSALKPVVGEIYKALGQ